MDDAALLARAHAAWPATWLPAATFLAHVAALRAAAAEAVDPATLHLGDLYLACACAHGVPDALAALERDHLVRVREFAASVDASPGFVQELTQQLRARLLVATPGRPARIASYAGRGSLGGWVRVAAVRLARDLARAERDAAARGRDDAGLRADALDPELAYLQRAYGDAVSRAMQDALAALDDRSRALLKLHYVDGVSIEKVGLAFGGKSRATSARMLAAARLALVAGIRARLVDGFGVRADEADSLIAFVRSRLDVSLGRALGR